MCLTSCLDEHPTSANRINRSDKVLPTPKGSGKVALKTENNPKSIAAPRQRDFASDPKCKGIPDNPL